MKFILNQPDHELSPYTGMRREHWLSISHFYLEGIFRHVAKMGDPILVPRHEFSVSYPQPNGPKWRLAAEAFEGLARSFLIAAPLLHNEPDAVVCGYSLREYYRNQILSSVTPENKNYLLRVEEIRPEALPGEIAFQHTCECASLVIGLTMCQEVIWDSYTKEEKDKIADYLSNFGHSHTGHHNWRLFNMLILAFLDAKGYEIDHGMMRDHAQVIVSYYAGDGWYRDGHLFDYYCPWAFHVYGPLWNQWYGYEKEPYLAQKIEQYSNDLVKNYPHMFDEDGHVTMWGRSGSYRSAATAPLAANFLLKNPTVNPGLSRRITSGAVLQFAQREECFYEGVPCLGFYGPFQPFVQSYSCAASPFWLANSFLCLMLPKDHPFWTEKESNGVWETMKEKETVTTVLDGPGIVMDNHKDTGITEFRTAKALMKKKYPSLNAYMRLSFNSQFPWEDFDFKGVEAMQYSLCIGTQEALIPNIMMYAGVKDGVLYRKEYFDFEFTFQNKSSIDLADFPVSHGIVRVDKVRIPDKPYTLTLGAYGMADRGDITIMEYHCPITKAKAMVMKSSEGQIAFVTYAGWDETAYRVRESVSPVTKQSQMLYGASKREKYYEYKPYAMISAVLTKKEDSDWKEEELFPIQSIIYQDPEGCGGYGPIKIILKDGKQVVVDYEGMEGRLMV
ncbi:MAG: DUF2264 domain-containing protein [Anaerocolumna sp.]